MKPPKIILIAALLLIAGLCLWWFGPRIDKDEIIRFGRSIPAWSVIAAMLVLPMLGFPISVLLVVIGLRFGLGWGAAISFGCIYLHHLAAWPLCRMRAGEPLRNWLRRKAGKMGEPGSASPVLFTAAFAAFHGPPYTLKLYLLALTSVPFPIYLWIGGTVYAVLGLIPVAAAASAAHVDLTWIYWFITLATVLPLAWRWWRGRRSRAE